MGSAGQAELMKNSNRLVPVLITVVITGLALSGCSKIIDTIQPEKSNQFTSTQDLAKNWNQRVTWLPADATQITTQEASAGGAAILGATTPTKLDVSQCAETERQSAPAYSEPWSPKDVYVDRVFACGDWAVIKTDSGWYGWTPNDPDEKSVSPTP